MGVIPINIYMESIHESIESAMRNKIPSQENLITEHESCQCIVDTDTSIQFYTAFLDISDKLCGN